jgi:hypothetical protein
LSATQKFSPGPPRKGSSLPSFSGGSDSATANRLIVAWLMPNASMKNTSVVVSIFTLSWASVAPNDTVTRPPG